jgi:hypothetical protein
VTIAQDVIVIHDDSEDDLLAEVIGDTLFLDTFNYRDRENHPEPTEHVDLALSRDDALALAAFIREKLASPDPA